MTEIETVPVASAGAMPEIAPALPEQVMVLAFATRLYCNDLIGDAAFG